MTIAPGEPQRWNRATEGSRVGPTGGLLAQVVAEPDRPRRALRRFFITRAHQRGQAGMAGAEVIALQVVVPDRVPVGLNGVGIGFPLRRHLRDAIAGEFLERGAKPRGGAGAVTFKSEEGEAEHHLIFDRG